MGSATFQTPAPDGTEVRTSATLPTSTPAPTARPCWCYWLCREGLASAGPSGRSPGLAALARQYYHRLRQIVGIVELLQDVRDHVMAQTSEGQRLISLYEELSPTLAESILPDPALTDEGDAVVNLFV